MRSRTTGLRRGLLAAAAAGMLMLGLPAAASAQDPPYPSWALSWTYGPVTASDGVRADTWCATYKANTGFGPIRNCIQYFGRPWRARTGNVNLISGQFYADTGWLAYNPDNFNHIRRVCGVYYFNGLSGINTGYGPIAYGQIYRRRGGRWQAANANLNFIAGRCFATGAWRGIGRL
jgi:hypothetical protein